MKLKYKEICNIRGDLKVSIRGNKQKIKYINLNPIRNRQILKLLLER